MGCDCTTLTMAGLILLGLLFIATKPRKFSCPHCGSDSGTYRGEGDWTPRCNVCHNPVVNDE